MYNHIIIQYTFYVGFVHIDIAPANFEHDIFLGHLKLTDEKVIFSYSKSGKKESLKASTSSIKYGLDIILQSSGTS